MDDLYNSVLATYSHHFSELPFKYQFHFASRLYLYLQLPIAKTWLEQLRAEFTADNHPVAALAMLKDFQLEKLSDHPEKELHLLERLLFRALFLETIYELPGSAALLKITPLTDYMSLRDKLLADPAQLVKSSATSVNFLYLLDRFICANDGSLTNLPKLVRNQLDLSETSHLKRWCYLLTHAVLGESLFYARQIPAEKQIEFHKWFSELETQIIKSQNDLNLDCQYEFLICCQLIGLKTKLILDKPSLMDGFIIEPLRTGPQTLVISEHRNVLFLMTRGAIQAIGQ